MYIFLYRPDGQDLFWWQNHGGIEPETFWAKGPSEPSAFRDMESGMPHGKDPSSHKWPRDGLVHYIEYQSFPWAL